MGKIGEIQEIIEKIINMLIKYYLDEKDINLTNNFGISLLITDIQSHQDLFYVKDVNKRYLATY